MITRILTNADDALVDGSGNPLVNTLLEFFLVDEKGKVTYAWDVEGKERIAPGPVRVYTDENGEFSVPLWPTSRGDKILYWLSRVASKDVSDVMAPLLDGVGSIQWADWAAGGTPPTPAQLDALAAHLADTQIHFNWREAWDAETDDYKRYDAVSHGGSSWKAKQDVPAGTEPAEGLYWTILAAAGLQGAPGVLAMNPQYRLRTPIVTFIDDDGDIAVWNRLKPVFDAAGVPLVVAIPADYVGGGSNLSPAQLVALQGAGWEIASHSHTHTYHDMTPGATDDSVLIDELQTSKTALSALGLTINHFVYPGGTYNERYAQLARQFYRSASILGEYYNTGPLRTWTLGRRHFGGGSFSYAQQTAAVDKAIADNSWLIFVTHCNAATLSDPELADLVNLIAYIKGQGVPIVTVQDAMNRVGNFTDFGYYPQQATMAAGFPQNPFFCVGSEGRAAINPRFVDGVATLITSLNEFSSTSIATDFPQGKICITTIDAAGKAGFPNNVAGTLITMRVGNKDAAGEGWTKQTYHAYSGVGTWERTWDGVGNVWLAWSQVIHTTENMVQVSATDAYDANTAVTAFPSGAITYTKIDNAGKATFPGPSAGMLVTNRLPSGANDYHRQEYHVYQSDQVYVRFWTGSAWTAWVDNTAPTIEEMAVNAVDANTAITGFNSSRIIFTKIDTAGKATFPEAAPGVLVTYKYPTGSNDYQWQEYHIYGSTRIYRRYWTGSAWSAWAIVNDAVQTSADDAFTAANVLTDFTAGKITHTTITGGGSATFPRGAAGLLITDRVTATAARASQRYIISQEFSIYYRYWTGAAWSAWYTERDQRTSTRGDVNLTLTGDGTYATLQLWNTALTANRTITLSTAGAATGTRFRIVRTGGDTGGPWTLAVGALKNLAANTWCEIQFDGAAWGLTAYGAL